MNIRKLFSLSRLLNIWILLVLTLTSCGTNSSEAIVTPAATRALPTLISFPTETPSPPTPTAIPQTPIPLFPLDNFRVVYLIDGNLYVQDNNNLPIQITNSGKEDVYPRFSEDGKKIIFNRREFGDNKSASELYSINVDGKQEQILFTKEWLDAFSLIGESFIPKTHDVLFGTSQCLNEHDDQDCMNGLYIANADTGMIKEFIKPRMINKMNIEISPDGKMIAFASAGRVDIYSINGSIIYSSIMNYTISTPDELEPMINWLPDSSGLVVALPKNINAGWAFPYYFSYDVWNYKLGEQAIYVPLDGQQPIATPQCGDRTSLSPDGTLLFYSRESEVFLGHLQDGHTQLIGMGCSSNVYWSPDSRHFIYRDNSLNRFIGSVDGSPPIPTDYHYGEFIAWIDSNYYVCIIRSINPEIDSKIFVVEINEGRALIYESGISLPGGIYSYDFILP